MNFERRGLHARDGSGQNTNFNPASLFPQLPIVNNGGFPQVTMTGYTGMFYDTGKGYPFPQYDIEIVDNFTKVRGRHTFKVGVDGLATRIAHAKAVVVNRCSREPCRWLHV
jgi:hypothetical protein